MYVMDMCIYGWMDEWDELKDGWYRWVGCMDEWFRWMDV